MTDPDTFESWWAKQWAEWSAIRDELIDKAGPGGFVSAHDVTTEQYRRMNDRGESVFAARQRIAKYLETGT